MHNISKRYDTGRDAPVLDAINLKIDSGEFVAIMGPSGSGKTTLMNILGLLDRPTSGTYLLADKDTASLDDASLAHLRNHSVGFVFQSFNLLARRSVIENISLPLLYRGETHVQCRKRAEEALARVGLTSHRDYLPPQLSGGQQQRVAIARTLAASPQLILADEPTGSLDTHTGEDIMALFSELNRQGITIVMITHELEVAKRARRLIHIRDGRIEGDA